MDLTFRPLTQLAKVEIQNAELILVQPIYRFVRSFEADSLVNSIFNFFGQLLKLLEIAKRLAKEGQKLIFVFFPFRPVHSLLSAF